MQNLFQQGFTPFTGRQVHLRGMPQQAAVQAVPSSPVPQPMAAPTVAPPAPAQVAQDPRTGHAYPVLKKGDSRGSCPVCNG